MTARKILFFISLACIVYLLVDSFCRLDFLATMNNGYIAGQKAEIDSISGIDSVKQKAKQSLDVIRHRNRSDGSLALRYFYVLVFLLIIQVFLWPHSKGLTKSTKD